LLTSASDDDCVTAIEKIFLTEVKMLNLLVLIAVILIVLWLLGFILHFIAGPLLYILLVIGLIFLVVWLVQRVRIKR
jgi:hypothetical protein